MSHSPTSFRIEVARPDAFDDVVAIDDDATELYANAGVELALEPSHPFAVAEQARWRRSTDAGRAFFLVEAGGTRVGVAVLDELDGEPYLDQLSVRTSATRRGYGRALLRRAIAWARTRGGRALWLTTYGHLPFNRAFYESEGFVVVPEPECGPGIAHHLHEQRLYLPAPEHRVAMRLRLERHR